MDDTAANLKLLVSMLSSRGYRVRAAGSGPLALRSILVYMIKQNPKDYQRFRDGMKETTATLFVRFSAFLENGVFSY